MATSRKWGDRASIHCDKMPSTVPNYRQIENAYREN